MTENIPGEISFIAKNLFYGAAIGAYMSPSYYMAV